MSLQRPLLVALAVFDKAAGSLLASHLRRLGCTCVLAESMPAFEGTLRNSRPDLIIVELGRKTVALDKLATYAGMATVIALSAPDPELFFQIARSGIEAVFPLPLDPLEYTRKLQQICRRLQSAILSAESAPLPTKADSKPDLKHDLKNDSKNNSTVAATEAGHALHSTIPNRFATSEDMTEVREMIEKVAPTSAAVLIRGESGVGKELAARLIHSHSLRASQAFIKVNCAAIPNDLLESELFGYEVGAFTGAVKAKPGKFEMADGGTIFLDEIGEMHPMLQAKLLHVLQDGDFARLGSKRDIAVDVRVICATNRQLDQLVARGEFREDLYYRINVITISLPPLRARKREIPELLQYFVRRYSENYNKPAAPFDADAVALLIDYDWPGNIRELENLCKRYVIVGNATQIMREIVVRRTARAAASPAQVAGLSASIAIKSPLASPASNPNLSLLEIGRRAAWAAERVAIEAMLQETHWNRREAARRLQISYKALLNKIQILDSESEVLEAVSR